MTYNIAEVEYGFWDDGITVIYICTGEHDDNIIFVHEIDWKIQMNDRNMSLMLLATLKIVSCLKKYDYSDDDNTDIVKLLCLPTLLYKHV